MGAYPGLLSLEHAPPKKKKKKIPTQQETCGFLLWALSNHLENS